MRQAKDSINNNFRLGFSRSNELDGGCTPVPTVFDNYCHIFILQTFRTGLQTPSSQTDDLKYFLKKQADRITGSR
ncbi:hypothetical protein Mettu_2287 [Methylobacter tundripaludum SV96]|uniref:Uncharacterized protein n=1 Tax=Methylobacter tundripaludum (strain ATCC BAA-1195 / DSM 17260 / SV96) TaxID=697282 RepID=G3IXM6_METTV|nr:hypothetical protein Mettu_2287 [Methylobacter tundripaludum SV96]